MPTVQHRELTDEELREEIDHERLSPHRIVIRTWDGAVYEMRWTKHGIAVVCTKERED